MGLEFGVWAGFSPGILHTKFQPFQPPLFRFSIDGGLSAVQVYGIEIVFKVVRSLPNLDGMILMRARRVRGKDFEIGHQGAEFI